MLYRQPDATGSGRSVTLTGLPDKILKGAALSGPIQAPVKAPSGTLRFP